MIFTEYSKQLIPVTRRWLGVALMANVLWVAAPAWAELPATQQYGSVEYLTGGFGIDESTAIKKIMPEYPLAFMFTAGDGQRSAYISQVQVVVRDQHDATVLNVESQGPFLLARIVPGTYHVHATYKNQTQSRPVTVTDDKSTRVVFEWPREEDSEAVDKITSTPDSQPASSSDSQTEFTPGSIPGLD